MSPDAADTSSAPVGPESATVVVWGTYDTGKPRTRILIDALKGQNARVIEIHADIWSDVPDKSRLGPLAMTWRMMRLLAAYPALVFRYLAAPDHDAVIVPYMGQFDVLVLKPFAALRRRAIVWDMFLSLYDTMVNDRRMLRSGSLLARGLMGIERLAARASSRVLLDTTAHASWITELLDLPQRRADAVPLGAETDVFRRLPPPETTGDRPTILFYGQLIPLHGIGTILAAALSERGRAFDWHLIGSGQEEDVVRNALGGSESAHVRWEPWVDYEDLLGAMETAQVCLGIFGTSRKADSVVPNKVWQSLQAGRPVVTRASRAMTEVFGSARPGLSLVPPGDPDALIEAIDGLLANGLPVADVSALLAGPAEIGREMSRVLADVDGRGAPCPAI